ncbi:MAG: adenine phosphoribosyltransferase [Acidimicrobiaceae bacterium]|nr:adenine phosphoribosyltransferase [Acidimicrobiaceae bacterium]MXW62153.1 adenine phosphoribosyltransferase [Acidimicrobiaceae bacterium]MXW75958.1 adenine phosphoribosyltransferase [Acidimicrobiaceae bacterium]MYC43357.1 adenine phosphoribosyltransferase [Acidimicrobiaceae bacterium]MYD06099.1 adenine phosphoribosyltransferase [Acidimicrobiaceae bacterium]
MDVICDLIRDVEDFPEPGIVFKDITPLLSGPDAFETAIDAMVAPWLTAEPGSEITKVVGIESRGFIFGVPIAQRLSVGFVPIRKKGKLPFDSIAQSYNREYGPDTIEIHTDAVGPGDRVLIVDDVLATAGTALAAATLIGATGATVAGFSILIELEFFAPRSLLGDFTVESVVVFGGD